MVQRHVITSDSSHIDAGTLAFKADVYPKQRDGMRRGVEVQSVVPEAKLLSVMGSLWIL